MLPTAMKAEVSYPIDADIAVVGKCEFEERNAVAHSWVDGAVV